MGAENTLLKGLGQAVRRRRRGLKLSAREVASKAAISPRFYGQLEAGEANISLLKLHAVAGALEVGVGELLRCFDQPAGVVALLGIRGAGKSSVGVELARLDHREFVEVDASVEDASGLSLSEIFTLYGEDYYRRVEAECITGLLKEKKRLVLALSGGVVHNVEVFERLRGECVTVWLKAEPEEYMERVLAQGDSRPMSNRDDAMAELKQLIGKREPHYAKSRITLTTTGKTPGEIARLLQTRLQDLTGEGQEPGL